MNSLQVFAPAKVNLFLAITGRRPDGFHNLVSVVAPIEHGDDLVVRLSDSPGFALVCDAPGVPTDETNLVMRAARLFAERTGWRGGAHFTLKKRVPAGAGLGGGSSDGTAALKALNELTGMPLAAATLAELAAQLGSDCVLFLHDAPSVIRGRGEFIEPLTAGGRAGLSGKQILLFKPDFGINTAWAYKEMAKEPRTYLPAEDAESRLAAWMRNPTDLGGLVFNNMERVAFRKFLALPSLLQKLRDDFEVTVGMSGSGSCCFALPEEGSDVGKMTQCIHDAWGEAAFVVKTRIR